jgi:hypothetical protein
MHVHLGIVGGFVAAQITPEKKSSHEDHQDGAANDEPFALPGTNETPRGGNISAQARICGSIIACRGRGRSDIFFGHGQFPLK